MLFYIGGEAADNRKAPMAENSPIATDVVSDAEVKEAQVETPTESNIPKEYVEKYKEFAERYDKTFAKELVEHYKLCVEKYGKELADYAFQVEVDIYKIAKLHGSKLRDHYHFPELEGSLINRLRFAQAIDEEGFKPKEIAKRFGYNIHTVYSYIEYAKHLEYYRKKKREYKQQKKAVIQ